MMLWADSTRNGTSTAKCKEKINKVWRIMEQQCLSPTSGKRQTGQVCEPTLLLHGLKLEISFQTLFLAGEGVYQGGPCHTSEGSGVKMSFLGNFCNLGEFRLDAASDEGRAFSWPLIGCLAVSPDRREHTCTGFFCHPGAKNKG